MSGFVMLPRPSDERWGWLWQLPADRLKVALILMERAAWKPRSVFIDGRRFQLERGQLVISMAELENASGGTKKRVRLAVEGLVEGGFLGKERAGKRTLFTVKIFASCDESEGVEGQRVGTDAGNEWASNRATKGQRVGQRKGKVPNKGREDVRRKTGETPCSPPGSGEASPPSSESVETREPVEQPEPVEPTALHEAPEPPAPPVPLELVPDEPKRTRSAGRRYDSAGDGLARTAVTWLAGQTGARLDAASDSARKAARRWRRAGWTWTDVEGALTLRLAALRDAKPNTWREYATPRVQFNGKLGGYVEDFRAGVRPAQARARASPRCVARGPIPVPVDPEEYNL